jgi:hypothetical protein
MALTALGEADIDVLRQMVHMRTRRPLGTLHLRFSIQEDTAAGV